MQLLRLFENGMPESDPSFAKRLDADLELCGFSEELKRGFLFFLGWSTPLLLEEQKDQSLTERLITLYSVPSGSFSDYGELNDFVFAKQIYTANYLVHKALGQIEALDGHLRSIRIGKEQQTIGKTNLDDELLKQFESLELRLEPLTNLFDSVFINMGTHLDATGFSYQKSYEAGFAFYNMHMHTDVNGTRYFINILKEALPSIYSALTRYPFLYLLHKEELAANHIFSTILQFLCMGVPAIIKVPIHRMHQFIFYEPGTARLRDVWSDWSKDSIMNVFLNAATIRKTELFGNQDEFLAFEGVHKPGLKGAEIGIMQLFIVMQNTMHEKYGLSLSANCNHSGEFMQMLAALFYETCLHSMVLKDLDFEGSI